MDLRGFGDRELRYGWIGRVERGQRGGSHASSVATAERGPEGNVLLPGSKKYDMQLITEFPNSNGSDSECRKAELTINKCEWGKDSGEYSLSLVSTTSDDMPFLFTISLALLPLWGSGLGSPFFVTIFLLSGDWHAGGQWSFQCSPFEIHIYITTTR